MTTKTVLYCLQAGRLIERGDLNDEGASNIPHVKKACFSCFLLLSLSCKSDFSPGPRRCIDGLVDTASSSEALGFKFETR